MTVHPSLPDDSVSFFRRVSTAVAPEGPSPSRGNHHCLEAVVTGSAQPLADGARELLAHGFDPAALLTMRMEGKTYDSFAPLPIGTWAGWTCTEGETTSLRCARWVPRPAVGKGQKSTSKLSDVPNPTPEQKRLYEATFRTAA
jgi:hypothetical protein